MSGGITVESAPGKGSCFTVRALFDPGTHDMLKASQASKAPADFHFNGHTLLLAEDVPINREIVLALLEDTKVTIDCAENGKAALEMVKAAPEKYDIVFMDIQMPKMDGLEATRRIRALSGEPYEKLPIIAMTANVFKSDVEQCLAAGMNGHLGKPLDIDKIMEILRKYLLDGEA
jgi:CheY-like chemotaxis protein